MDRQEKNKINKSKTILMDYKGVYYIYEEKFFNEGVMNTKREKQIIDYG